MQDFYRTYGNHPVLLRHALQLGWIQNVVIMEAKLTMELRKWYIKAAKQFGRSKTELIANIAANAHENIVLANGEEMSDVVEKEGSQAESNKDMSVVNKNMIHYAAHRIRKWWLLWKDHRRRNIMSWELFPKKRIIFIRCKETIIT